LRVPAIGVDMLVVNGTDAASLKRGPGRYAGTRADLGSYAGAPPPASMPGEGQLVYVAGHRTTYGAPFADIDKIARGDRVRFELPYAVFDYVVSEKRIVAASETAVLRSRGVEEIVLQACHPRFSAARRYLVYAKAVRVTARAPA